MAQIATKGLDRFNRFPWYAQYVYLYPWIRRFLLPAFPTLIGIWMGALLSFISPVFLLLIPLGFIGSGAYIFRYLDLDAVKESKEGVPQFGLHEFFGIRLPEIFDEGAVMKMPGTRVVLRSKEKFNIDLPVLSTRCRLDSMISPRGRSFFDVVSEALKTPAPADIKVGGEVEIVLGLTFERNWQDGWDILDYDELGETEGFLPIITDDIEDDLKELGRRLTWYQLGFATDLASASLICKLTGTTHYEYKGEAREIFDKPTPEFISAFLNEVQRNGLSYINGTGIKIFRARLKSVDAKGDLKKAADQAAIEYLRREGLLANVDALKMAARKLKLLVKDDSMTMKDIINTVQVDDKDARVEKKIVEFAANDIDKLAQVVMQILTKVGGQTPPTQLPRAQSSARPHRKKTQRKL